MINSDFNFNLKVTAKWCQGRQQSLSIDERFRAREVSPRIDIGDFSLNFLQKKEEIDRLVYERKKLVKPAVSEELNFKGRVIVFYPERSLQDGFLAIESEGFFDSNDFLPWDTWFYYDCKIVEGESEELLYAWVPQASVRLIENALNNVEHYNSYDWLG